LPYSKTRSGSHRGGVIGREMGRILIYTLAGDSACARAKELLIQKQRTTGTALVEINLTDYPKRSREMKRLTGKRSVPQIFFNSLHVGVLASAPLFPAISLIAYDLCIAGGSRAAGSGEVEQAGRDARERCAHKVQSPSSSRQRLISHLAHLINAQLPRRRHHPRLCPQATRTSSWPKR
jgi:glutaredoxin